VKRLARRAAVRLATSDRFERTVLALSPVRSLAFRRATRYVAGTDEEAALRTVRALASQGLYASVDLFGENVTDPALIDADTNRLLALVGLLAEHPCAYVSLDCSHFGLDRDPNGCRDRVARIARALPEGSRLQLGAEDSTRTDAILDIAHGVADEGLPIMATIQANLRRSPKDAERLATAGIPIRLVKGAYAEPADHAWPAKRDVDANYLALSTFMLPAVKRKELRLVLGTHDLPMIRRITSFAEALGIEKRDVEVNMLYGIQSEALQRLAAEGHTTRQLISYGNAWYAWYVRRLAERPENMMFVARQLFA
jgi:proline dehydrogenase